MENISADALAQMGHFREAAWKYAESIKCDPRASSFVARAECLQALGQLREAVACLEIGQLTLGEHSGLEMKAAQIRSEIRDLEASHARKLQRG